MNLVATSNWHQRWLKTLERIRCVLTQDELDDFMDRLVKPERPTTLAFVNAHAMNCVAANEDFGSALWRADIVVRDGSGMSILLRALARPPGFNLNGTDLIPRIIARHAGQGIALFGTVSPWLDEAAAQVRSTLAPASWVTTLDGFQPSDDYLEWARRHKPALIVLGMGMPKQEKVAAQLRDGLDYPCLIVCGGAIIDFMGGRVPRAPLWIRDLGIEWAFRLCQEPRRLFERYVLGNPVFLMRSMRFRRWSGKWNSST